MPPSDQILPYVSASFALVGLLLAVFGALRSNAFRPIPEPGDSISRTGFPQEQTGPQLLLREYHSQGLGQSRVSFWFSLIFASLGFLVIMFAALTTGNGPVTSQGKSVLALLGGAVINAFSGLLLVQSNRARTTMVDFFDRLRLDEKRSQAVKLCGEIPDPALQGRLRALLALHLAEVPPTDSMLRSMLDVPENQGERS